MIEERAIKPPAVRHAVRVWCACPVCRLSVTHPGEVLSAESTVVLRRCLATCILHVVHSNSQYGLIPRANRQRVTRNPI